MRSQHPHKHQATMLPEKVPGSWCFNELPHRRPVHLGALSACGITLRVRLQRLRNTASSETTWDCLGFFWPFGCFLPKWQEDAITRRVPCMTSDYDYQSALQTNQRLTTQGTTLRYSAAHRGFATPAPIPKSRLTQRTKFGTAGATIYGRNPTRLTLSSS